MPEFQLRALLAEINKQFPKARAHLTDELREDGLAINFDFEGVRPELRPRWLALASSRAQHEYLASILPFPAPNPNNMGQDRSLKAFKAKMALAVEISKTKSKAKKKAIQESRLTLRMEMAKQTLRAQRYLGLLPKKDDSLDASMAVMGVQAIDPSIPPPFPFDQEPIIISIDCEAWENPPYPVTEVGVATLDTRDLKGIAPGRVGEDWQKRIRGRHFRIMEYMDLKNCLFVEGCPERFEFGKSECVSKVSIGQVLANCFKEPYSGPLASTITGEPRNLIILGHDISQDVNYLTQIGFNVMNRSNIIESMDTAAMYRSYTQEPNPRSLGSVLVDFNLTGWHLHNAGNDAVYTMWAMLAIAVQDACQRGSKDRVQSLEQNVEAKTEIAVEEAKERVRSDAQGWKVSAGDEDGGVPLPPKERDFESRRDKARKNVGPQ